MTSTGELHWAHYRRILGVRVMMGVNQGNSRQRSKPAWLIKLLLIIL